MEKYFVTFKKGNKTHIVKVQSQGLVPAIEAAVITHFRKYQDALGYEIVEAHKAESYKA